MVPNSDPYRAAWTLFWKSLGQPSCEQFAPILTVTCSPSALRGPHFPTFWWRSATIPKWCVIPPHVFPHLCVDFFVASIWLVKSPHSNTKTSRVFEWFLCICSHQFSSFLLQPFPTFCWLESTILLLRPLISQASWSFLRVFLFAGSRHYNPSFCLVFQPSPVFSTLSIFDRFKPFQ